MKIDFRELQKHKQILLKQAYDNKELFKDILTGEELQKLGFTAPIEINLQIKLIMPQKAVIMGQANTNLILNCVRCNQAFSYPQKIEVNLEVEQKELTNNILDLGALLYQELMVSLPMKFLCSSDCKGLCPKCGKNLNLGPCDC